jgi:uncharacterized protein (DUF924 family)
VSAPDAGGDWVEAVLHFWFAELAPAAWFRRSAATDATIRARFLVLHETLTRAVPACTSPRQCLAAVIVLDQFSRNLFRNDARAYAADADALRLARAAIAAGFDSALGTTQREFLYMPFMHAEDRAAQDEGVALYERLGTRNARYAREHRALIERFGRFPHRNAVLERESTPAEAAYLDKARPS